MHGVYSFFSADHKTGTTSLCRCCARRLATLHPELKILLIYTEHGSEYPHEVGESLEHIKNYLKRGLLDTESLVQRSCFKDNLYMLGGPGSPCCNGDYEPSMAAYLLDSIGDHFDVILCDCGAELERGFPLGLLMASRGIYLVFLQNETCFRKYEWMQSLYKKLELPIRAYVLNAYSKSSPYSGDYFVRRFGDHLPLYIVRNLPQYESEQFFEHDMTLHYPKGFLKEIDALAEDMVHGI